ncbi:MAG: ABC transporter permease [Geminicoccaceae bacterium]|nr:MAG: ABC transporter permease [Geminicoccaceae bacterium]
MPCRRAPHPAAQQSHARGRRRREIGDLPCDPPPRRGRHRGPNGDGGPAGAARPVRPHRGHARGPHLARLRARRMAERGGSGEMDDVSRSAPTRSLAPRFSMETVRQAFPLVLLAGLCLAFASASDRFLTVNNAMIVLQQSAVLLVAAVAMTFVIVNGSIDLSVGSTVALSALVAAALSAELGMWAILPAIGVGLLCGLFNGLLFAYGRIPSFIVTLGTLVIFRGLVLFYTRGAPVSIRDMEFLSTFAGRSFGVPHTVIIALTATVIAAVIFNQTVFGREVRAVGGGEKVALLSGIRVQRVKLMVFVVSGALCGLAGLLQASRTMAATAQLAEGLELDVIAAVVVGGTPLTGGVGRIRGTVLGVLIIAILSNGMNMTGVDPHLQKILKGVVLIAAVFLTIDRSKISVIK